VQADSPERGQALQQPCFEAVAFHTLALSRKPKMESQEVTIF
jgi:hypothetical protein